MLQKSGFNVDRLSKKYNIPPKLLKIYIKLLIAWKNLFCSKINLITCEYLIQKTYKYLEYQVSTNEINEQAGNILEIDLIASHFDKTKISRELASKIEREFERLSELCVSRICYS